MEISYSVLVFCQAEDGIRDLVRSRGLGDVYKRQVHILARPHQVFPRVRPTARARQYVVEAALVRLEHCLLYTSDAADERSSVDLGGRRIIKKKKQQNH